MYSIKNIIIPHTIVALSAIYYTQMTINLYQEMKRNEMKCTKKKIIELANINYNNNNNNNQMSNVAIIHFNDKYSKSKSS